MDDETNSVPGLALSKSLVAVIRDSATKRSYKPTLMTPLSQANKYSQTMLNTDTEGVIESFCTDGVSVLSHYTFLGNCPPTPPLSQHFALNNKVRVHVA